MIKKIEDTLNDFLLKPQFRIYRHLFLLLASVAVAMNILWDVPDKIIWTGSRIGIAIIYLGTTMVMIYFNIYVLVPKFLIKNKFTQYILSAIGLVTFSLIAIVMMQEFLYSTPGIAREHVVENEINPNAYPAEEDQSGLILAAVVGITSSIFGTSLLIAGVSAFMLFRYWIMNNQRISDLKSETLQSELNFLKSQINPHFLFNMLNNANIMVDEDPEMASRILTKLDGMLRYQINDSTRDKVDLKEDILFLTSFLDLEKTRRDHFEYSITQEGDLDHIEVPPLLFIPFVENAVKHNPDNNNLSYVYLFFELKDNELTFKCKNSKPDRPIQRKVGGLGLANIRRRLDLLYGNNYSLELEETETTYTATLQLKL
ncbi:histidine kinase [Dysgonomonas alginatilytica]|uniref:Histidine kinase n=1 Tax=Dysgonomonas alginatilytica TaxID=1605892 RepID=A0A2V3PMX2_9BACT|nr:histidine kinase [Dysgonomonas alginatilytica]PXV62329.1 histidine kinase [Dysgonomonas alginatilytica]